VKSIRIEIDNKITNKIYMTTRIKRIPKQWKIRAYMYIPIYQEMRVQMLNEIEDII